MASYIKTLKEDNGDITYPQTLASAVFTSGGSDVETEMGKYVTAEDIASTSALTPPVTTNMIVDGAVTTAKIDDGAVTKAKVDATTYDGGTEDGWTVSYLPNGKKMWYRSGEFTTASFNRGAANWGYAQNICSFPTSVVNVTDVHVFGWAEGNNGSGSTRCFVNYGSLAGGGTRKFGISVSETYGSGTGTNSGVYSIMLIEK